MNRIYDEKAIRNEFEEDMEKLKEWQDNQYNPEHYIGTGKVPRPFKQLGNYPIRMIITAMLFISPAAGFLIMSKEKGFSSLLGLLLPVFIYILLLYRGIGKLIVQHKERSKRTKRK